jgi:uncharacterized protein (DUF1499 family)
MGGAEEHLRETLSMARRRITEEPMARTALWARRLALFALVATMLSIIIVRSGLLEIKPALATFGSALGFAVASIVLAFAAFVVIWRQGTEGLGSALLALFIGLALLAYPIYLGVQAYRLPPITDVVTDPDDPPRFETIARLRPRDANPIAYPGRETAERQHAAYPEIEPLIVTSTPQQAYDTAYQVMTKRKWRILDARAPQANRREGRIEAVALTPIMGFREDVVLRVRADGEGARVDVRSASRYGPHDLGGNAARITQLLEEIDEILGVQEEKKPKPAPKRPAQVAKPAPAKR